MVVIVGCALYLAGVAAGFKVLRNRRNNRVIGTVLSQWARSAYRTNGYATTKTRKGPRAY